MNEIPDKRSIGIGIL